MTGKTSCEQPSPFNETTRKTMLAFHPKGSLIQCHSSLTPFPSPSPPATCDDEEHAPLRQSRELCETLELVKSTHSTRTCLSFM
jgi:hypothetical protein